VKPSLDYGAIMQILTCYGSLSNTAKKFATALSAALPSKCEDWTSIDLEELFAFPPTLLLLVLSSYNVETPLDSALHQWQDAANDFRVGNGALAQTHFAVLGVGDSAWAAAEYQLLAKQMDNLLEQLGAQRIKPLAFLDVASDAERDFETWQRSISSLASSKEALEEAAKLLEASDDIYESAHEDLSSESEGDESKPALTPGQLKMQAAKRKARAKLQAVDANADIEDLGAAMPALKAAVAERDTPKSSGERCETLWSVADIGPATSEDNRKEMLSSLTRKALTKQGYRLVGSHSGVKTCRWTKAALRSRGLCYKHTLYGIMSNQCMEATPSLACSSKCQFCWRSHTNPVGTSWRWKTDPPEQIVNESLAQHLSLIKQLKGLPDLNPERFEEALTPRHAALSLVGEPIMYPFINEYIRLLHQKRISTFLVTNAQFPEPMKTIPPVTQLYLSIDAGDKVALKEVDRPLHKDFWERMLACVDLLATKPERTVFRLTLVKEFNDDDLQGYAALIKRGRPDFVEVKGVTYCGYGATSGLTIKNSPFHEEVVRFVQALVDELDRDEALRGQYALASEHAHSNCVLAASTKYLVDGAWHTWIDYDRFFELVESGQPVKGEDYSCPTPEWAICACSVGV
jgi:tRNA wybutosine-synthesizing protein 1